MLAYRKEYEVAMSIRVNDLKDSRSGWAKAAVAALSALIASVSAIVVSDQASATHVPVISLRAVNWPDHYLRHRNFLSELTQASTTGARAASMSSLLAPARRAGRSGRSPRRRARQGQQRGGQAGAEAPGALDAPQPAVVAFAEGDEPSMPLASAGTVSWSSTAPVGLTAVAVRVCL